MATDLKLPPGTEIATEPTAEQFTLKARRPGDATLFGRFTLYSQSGKKLEAFEFNENGRKSGRKLVTFDINEGDLRHMQFDLVPGQAIFFMIPDTLDPAWTPSRRWLLKACDGLMVPCKGLYRIVHDLGGIRTTIPSAPLSTERLAELARIQERLSGCPEVAASSLLARGGKLNVTDFTILEPSTSDQ